MRGENDRWQRVIRPRIVGIGWRIIVPVDILSGFVFKHYGLRDGDIAARKVKFGT